MIRILGIDPGSRVLGYAVIATSGDARPRLEYVECGVLALDVRAPMAQRLGEIARGLGEVIEELEPHEVAVEDVFAGASVRSALALGQARGAALSACGLAGLAVTAYAPATIKLAVAGRGRAGKDQVAQMVRVLCGLKRTPRADAADALAVAIAHAHMRSDPFTRRRVARERAAARTKATLERGASPRDDRRGDTPQPRGGAPSRSERDQQ